MISIQPQGYYQPYNPIFDPEKQRTKEARKNLLRIGLALLVYLLLTSAVQATAMFLCARFAPRIYLQDWFTIACSLLSYAVGVPIFFGFIASMPKQKPQKARLGFGKWIAFLAISFLLMEAGSMIASFLMSAIEAVKGQEISNAIADQINGSSPLVNLVVAVILAPIFEELICRKLIIDRLLPYSEVLAVVTSGLLFGLIHGNFYQFFYATMLGMLFAAVYVKTGNIFHTIGMHAIINFTGSIIATIFNQQLPTDADPSAAITPWMLVATVYSLAMMVLAVCGGIFLVRAIKQTQFSAKGTQDLKLSSQFKAAWLNWGMILLVCFCILLFLFSLTI